MFCPSCGAETTGQTRFCRACGKPLNTGGSENPYETKMGQEAAKPQPPAADPFKTVVAMQAPPKAAPKPSPPPTPPPTPPPKAAEPDPFATQVSPSFDAAQVAKELAKAKAAKQAPPAPPASDIDSMQTVVGMQAVIPKPTPPPAAAPPSKGPDPMATMVAMPAVSFPPKKPTAAPPPPEPKPEAKVEVKPEPVKPPVASPSQNAPFAQTSVPQNYDPLSSLSTEEKKSSSMMYVIIGVVVVVVIIVIALMLNK